jgi:hypothetical protein
MIVHAALAPLIIAIAFPWCKYFLFYTVRIWISGWQKLAKRTSVFTTSGVPLSTLQEMGGRESIEMVRRYAHLAPDHLSEHARKIDAIFGNHDINTTQGENQAGLKLA